MSEVHSFELVFENVESIVVPADRIVKSEHGNLTKIDIEDDAYRSDHIELHIKYENESDLLYKPDREAFEVLGMFVGNTVSNRVDERPNVLGRLLNYHDLVDIQLYDAEDNRLKVIYVPWHEEDQYINRLQTVTSENGVLKISIKGQ